MKSSTREKYLEQKNQDLLQNLEILIRFINTHRFENGSGYKQWYKEKGLEAPAKPPEIKQRLYDFFKVYYPEALDFSYLPFSIHGLESISPDEKMADKARYYDFDSEYESWFNSKYYQLFKTEIYEQFASYVIQLVDNPFDSWPDFWQSTKMWFEYSIIEQIQMRTLTMELLQISDFFPQVEEHPPYTDQQDCTPAEDEKNEDNPGLDVTPYTDPPDLHFRIRIANLLPNLCAGLYSAVLLQQKESKKNRKREGKRIKLPVLAICRAHESTEGIAEQVQCDQLIALMKSASGGKPRFNCSDVCRTRVIARQKTVERKKEKKERAHYSR